MQISPQKEQPIIWHGADPNDTDTLYVRAVVQDALTLQTLNTVTLTDNGNHLFSGSFITPHDISQTGTGRHIIVTTTVYTDSGYTTPSQNYQRVTEQYLVKTLVDPYTLGGGGGGSPIDYRELKKVIAEVLAEKEVEPAVPLVIKQEFPIQAIIKAVNEEIRKIEKIELPEPTDLTPIKQSLENIVTAIRNLPQKATELSPVIDQLKALASFVEVFISALIRKQTREITETLQKNHDEMMKEIVPAVIAEIAKQIAEGKLQFSIFGDSNPFDGNKQKRENYLAGLAARYRS